jgi:acetoin utilization protein AcuC
MEALRLAWDAAFSSYDFGPEHPMAPARLELTLSLARELGLLSHAGVRLVGAEPMSDADLTSVHTPAFVKAVHAASQDRPVLTPGTGLGTDDVPVFPGMHGAAARIAQASRSVALAVWSGRARHGLNLAGGMHHAKSDRACGFCVYNDAALAIRALLDEGAQRVAYVDIDVHHGDGVEEIFWDEPRVLAISLHESGLSLFPGSGGTEALGGPGALGRTVNVPLPSGTGDRPWTRAFRATVPPLLRAFGPQVLVTQHGCDSHVLDPLGHLSLSVDCQSAAYRDLHDLAHEICDGRWVALGGGGYEMVQVVPRAWSHLIGIAVHSPVPEGTRVPPGWREYMIRNFGPPVPVFMDDGCSHPGRRLHRGPGGRADRDVDVQVGKVLATVRDSVFPLHGLDPRIV